MMNYHNLVIAPLSASHDRKSFHCNVETLDHYIHSQAGQDIKRHISRVFIASPPDNPKAVVGYYSLSTLSIELTQLPKHPIPAALIGRLAVSKNARKCGIGRMLLADAVKRTLSISEQIGIYAMVVDAIDDSAERFYAQFGFTRLSDDSSRLFLPIKSLAVI